MFQAPAQAGNSASGTSASADKQSTVLLNDPIFAAINNAFSIGWNLVELKSRIQITACNLSLDSITFDTNTATFSASVFNAPPPRIATLQNQPSIIDAVLHNIVLKDVATMQPVTNGTKSITTPAQSLSTELRDNAWLTSMFRTIFKQIVTLHIKRFPDSDTTDTIYDLPPFPQNEEGLSSYPYPYLYPLDDRFDYANVGIDSIQNTTNKNSTITSFATNFKLYDVTRRALNCLTLLLDDANEGLVPSIIDSYQRRLIQTISAAPSIPTLDADYTKIAVPSDDDLKGAIKALSNQAVRLLEAWDGFLRESFYVDRHSQNPQSTDANSLIIDNELELAAYEAGRSLAALSWSVSVATVPLENALNALTLTPEQQKDPNFVKLLAQKARSTWKNAFNDRDINHIQYQITTLSTALDDAYYRANPAIKRPDINDPSELPNPDLPGQAIQAITHSLDYWERAITRLCSSDDTMTPLLNPISATAPTPGMAGTAHVQTAPTAPPANTTSDPSPLLDWQLSKTLRAELIQQASIWQSLMLCQQSLRSFTRGAVTQRILNDFMQDLERATGEEIRKFRWTVIAITGAIAAIILLLIIAGLTKYQGLSLSGVIQSPLVIITAIGAVLTPFVAGIANRLSRLGSSFGSAGTALTESLQRGYERLLVEFDTLNHNVAITFPLIEFFIWEEKLEFDGNPIKDGYDFLVNVFWTGSDREEELQRVARAAFGPIAALVEVQLNKKPAKTPPKTSQARHS